MCENRGTRADIRSPGGVAAWVLRCSVRLTCHDAPVVTSRPALAGACLALAMLTASGCAQINEAVNDRDLECNGVPDDICITLADHIVGMWDEPAARGTEGPIVRVLLRPVDCRVAERREPATTRCWEVEASTATGSGISRYALQRVDGTFIGPNGKVIGN